MTAANTGPLPLLPPPPPPPPQAPPKQKVSSLIAHLPPECRPKVDSLVHLMMNMDDDFDPEERQTLMDSPEVGNELVKLLEQCEKPLASIKLLQNPNNEEDKQAHETNLMRLQTCLLRRSCPVRMQKFEQCWINVSRLMRGKRGEFDISRRTCQSERRALERCAGNLVARSVHEALQDDSPLDNEDAAF